MTSFSRKSSSKNFSSGASIGSSSTMLRRRLIFLVCVVASAAMQLTLSSSTANAAFAGRNGRIFFASEGDIFSVAPDGTQVKNLTAGAGTRYDRAPAVSPDGSRVVFMCQDTARGREADLCLMRHDGSNIRRLTANDVDETTPAWAPSGRKLVFVRHASTGSELVTMSVDRSHEQVILRNVTALSSPAWSPTGDRILFTAFGPMGLDHDIYSVRPDGTDERNLTSSDGGETITVGAWSPSGGRFVFARYNDEAQVNHLYVMRSDGSGEQRVGTVQGTSPAWSPSGRRITYTDLVRHANFELFKTTPVGSFVKKLSDHHSFSPNWGPRP